MFSRWTKFCTKQINRSHFSVTFHFFAPRSLYLKSGKLITIRDCWICFISDLLNFWLCIVYKLEFECLRFLREQLRFMNWLSDPPLIAGQVIDPLYNRIELNFCMFLMFSVLHFMLRCHIKAHARLKQLATIHFHQLWLPNPYQVMLDNSEFCFPLLFLFSTGEESSRQIWSGLVLLGYFNGGDLMSYRNRACGVRYSYSFSPFPDKNLLIFLLRRKMCYRIICSIQLSIC